MRSPNNKLSPEAFALALLLASSLQIMENLVPRVRFFRGSSLDFLMSSSFRSS